MTESVVPGGLRRIQANGSAHHAVLAHQFRLFVAQQDPVRAQHHGKIFLGGVRCQVKDVLAQQRFAPRENQKHLWIHLGNLIHHPPTLSRRQLGRRICTCKGAHIAVRAEEVTLLRQIPRD